MDRISRGTLEDLSWTISEKYERPGFEEYGLCGRCKEFKYRKTRLTMDMEVWCDAYTNNKPAKDRAIKPNYVDPITDCSDFYPKGQLALSDMSRIATLIDTKEHKIGFNSSIEREVIMTKPGED